ncbi:MAG: hypothetical protein LW690_08040 [Opitutaceae bacterium]|jgi:hypothetical protein|nr:hypothetical protein [Opitutaceae bacterium]
MSTVLAEIRDRWLTCRTAFGDNPALAPLCARLVAVLPFTNIGGLFTVQNLLPWPGWKERLAAVNTPTFRHRFLQQWLPPWCANRPPPAGPTAAWSGDKPPWNLHHHPDLFIPEPYDDYPSYLRIDLLVPARGGGLGRRLP